MELGKKNGLPANSKQYEKQNQEGFLFHEQRVLAMSLFYPNRKMGN
ncbi:MAG: hypothetical protein ACI85I_002772 [Arenicella sp.]